MGEGLIKAVFNEDWKLTKGENKDLWIAKWTADKDTN